MTDEERAAQMLYELRMCESPEAALPAEVELIEANFAAIRAEAMAEQRERDAGIIHARFTKEQGASDAKVGSMPDIAEQHEAVAIACNELEQAVRAQD